MSRRAFIAGVSAASLVGIAPRLARGSEANAKIRLGMIGCGGRGTWLANLFREHGGFEIVAAADYFQDRADAFGDKFSVPAARRYTGLSCYKRLLEGKVDAVAVESPPYFHAAQAAAAVDAGCHVYLAKPVAVDAPGCRAIAESGKKASGKKLCFLVDFQTRANEFFVEAMRRVHEGAIGEFAFGESSYHAGTPWGDKFKYLEQDPANPENRLRAWGMDVALSGDIITEQNIHTLDVASWIMNEPPVSATGAGGLKGRQRVGSCYDHYALLFQYPNNVGITFSSRQFAAYDTKPEGIRNRMFGSKGVLETHYGGQVLIRGPEESFYRGGDTASIYKDGAVRNIATFHENIIAGRFENPTVEPSVRSNLVTILGRTAAREGRQAYWSEIVKSEERLDPKLKGLKD